jgi:uncharacterized protein YbbC (DUF1343 family)
MAIQLGSERLATEERHLVAGRRIGVITNQTGIDGELRPIADVLQAAGAHIAAFFAPEHGLRGAVAAGGHVASSVEPHTGAPIHSLYGERTKPEPAMLEGLDALVYDIQDVGSRYYTIISTMALCAQAAGEAGLPLIVCDRPNPITGLHPEGNLVAPGSESFVGIAAYPMRHAMTVGELALLFRGEHGMGGEIHVAKMGGWNRSMWWEQTGLPWVMPSPNSTGIEMSLLYPGTCLFEGTSITEGRGYTKPYEVIGAPFVDGEHLAAEVNALGLAGVRARPAGFRPFAGKYAGEDCDGIQLHITDRDALRPAALGVHILAIAVRLYGERLTWRLPHFDRLAGSAALRGDLLAGKTAAEILAGWEAELATFLPVRERYLLYPERA